MKPEMPSKRPNIDKQPNILILMSDEHRFDVSGFMGNDVVRTPTLDGLAKDAVVFNNAYTPSPICIPGRQCLTTGLFPRHCRSERFLSDIAPNSMTFARRLSQYGYFTCCAGKLHHHGPDQMQGWQKRIAPDAEVHPTFIEGRMEETWKQWETPPGIGKFSNQKEIKRAGIGKGPWDGRDDIVEMAALFFLERYFNDPYYDRPQSHQPLLFKVSFNNPHYPFLTSADKFNYYLNRVPLYLDHERFDHPVLSRTQCGPDIEANPRDVKRATAAYYGMVESLDERFGRIIAKLEEVGQDIDDWLVIYLSDHGDMLGEHGVWEKTSFFEGSVRIPFFIRYPKNMRDKTPALASREEDSNVNACDLFATLCDVAGIPLPADTLDSRSLLPLCAGDTKDWPDETVSQINGRLMIKQGTLKYCYYEKLNGKPEAEVLFDLKNDPNELTDVSKVENYAPAMERFRERRGELKF